VTPGAAGGVGAGEWHTPSQESERSRARSATDKQKANAGEDHERREFTHK